MRNVLTIIVVMLGVSLLIGLSMAASSAMAEFVRYVGQILGETDLIIQYGNRMPFKEGNITTVEYCMEVEKYTRRVNWPAHLQNDTRKYVRIIGVDVANDWEFAGFNVSGSKEVYDTNVIISVTLAEKYHLGIGDSFNITTGVFNTENWNRTYQFSIVGIYHPTPSIVSMDVFMRLEEAQKISGLSGMVSTILVRLKDVSKTVEVRDQFQTMLGSEFYVSAPKVEAQKRINEMTSGFQIGLTVMMLIALLVSGFLIFNTMFTAVHERTYEIGVLRTIGGSRRQIFAVFFVEGLVLGFAGGTAGIPVGVVLSNLFISLFVRAFGLPKINLVLPPEAFVGGFLCGLLITVCGILYPAASASRINTVHTLRVISRGRREAVPDIAMLVVGLMLFMFGTLLSVALISHTFQIMSFMGIFFVPVGLIMVTAVLLRRTSEIFAAPVKFASNSIGVLLSRNVRRKLFRSSVGFGVIAMSLTFVIVLGGMEAGIVDAMEKSVTELFGGADIIIAANQTIPRTFVFNLTGIEGVEVAAAMGIFPLTKVWNGNNQSSVTVLVIDPETFPQIVNFTFVDSPAANEVYRELAIKNESLILSQSIAHRLQVSVGENVTVLSATGEKRNFTLVGIFTGAVLSQFWFGERPITESIFISFQSETAHFNGRDHAKIFFVNLKGEYKKKALEIAHLINETYPQFDFGRNTITLSDMLARVESVINQTFLIFAAFLYFTILIGILGIAIIMTMSVLERRREIGILMSLGMSRSKILCLFLIEAVLVSFIGFLVALPCGIVLLKGTSTTMTLAGLRFPFVVPWFAIGQSLIFALAAAMLGAAYPAYKASRLSVVEALRWR